MLSSIIIFISIIALLVLALFIPWIMGGAILGKIADYGNKALGLAADKTSWGKAIKGALSAPGALHKENMDRIETDFKGGTMSAMKTAGAYGTKIFSTEGVQGTINAFNQSRELQRQANAVKDAKLYLDNPDSNVFDNYIQSVEFKNKNKNDQKAIMKERARSGESIKTAIDSMKDILSEEEIDELINLNIKAQIKNNTFNPDNILTNPKHASPDNSIHAAHQFLENYNDYMNSANNNTKQSKVITQALKSIDQILKAGSADDKTTNAFTNLSWNIENNTNLANLRNNPLYKSLRNNASINTRLPIIQNATNAIAANIQNISPDQLRTMSSHFGQFMSKNINYDNASEKDIKTMLNAQDFMDQAGIKDANGFINHYAKQLKISPDKIDPEHRQLLETKWDDLSSIRGMHSEEEISQILNRPKK